ncbi:hypothetical protein LSAT2_022110 [Lamellibrachia satsuma]|nr:hypothetical protein LSAT2_022110 [Lamellibrachia satsuma]
MAPLCDRTSNTPSQPGSCSRPGSANRGPVAAAEHREAAKLQKYLRPLPGAFQHRSNGGCRFHRPRLGSRVGFAEPRFGFGGGGDAWRQREPARLRRHHGLVARRTPGHSHSAMPGPYNECQVRLQRDALNTPWGFRLQGGKDFKAPLTVQRVFVGSPADGELHRGDVIVAIDNYDATNMVHSQGMDLIKNAGGSLSLRIRTSSQPRSTYASAAPVAPAPYCTPSYQSHPASHLGGFTPKPQQPVQTTRMSYGVDYNPHQARPQPMLNRVQQSLSNVLWQGGVEGQYEDEEPYNQMSVNQLRSVFNAPSHPGHRQTVKELKQTFTRTFPRRSTQRVQQKPTGSLPRQRPSWAKPQSPIDTPPSMLEPGWTPRYMPQRSGPRPRPVNARPAPPSPPAVNNAPPAWRGSLKSADYAKPWDEPGTILPAYPMTMSPQPAPQQQQQRQQQQLSPSPAGGVQPHTPRVQNVHYGPGGAPEYQQHAPDEHDGDGAQVVHLQYNTPIGLYSRTNVEEALVGQTTGKPGEGSLIITGGGQQKPFNPANSSVYRMLVEEEEKKRNPQRTRQPYVDPRARAMQQQMLYADDDEVFGASDF